MADGLRPREIVALNIKRLIHQLGISQAEAGRRCNMGPQLMGQYVNCQRTVSVERLFLIARGLETTPEDLLRIDGVSEPVVLPLDAASDQVLKAAMGNVADAVVLGHDKNGEGYFASRAERRDILWLLERAKLKVLAS